AAAAPAHGSRESAIAALHGSVYYREFQGVTLAAALRALDDLGFVEDNLLKWVLALLTDVFVYWHGIILAEPRSRRESPSAKIPGGLNPAASSGSNSLL